MKDLIHLERRSLVYFYISYGNDKILNRWSAVYYESSTYGMEQGKTLVGYLLLRLAFMAACVTHVTWYYLIEEDGTVTKSSKTKTVITKLLAKNLKSNPSYKGNLTSEKVLDPDWEKTAKNVIIGKVNKLKRLAGCTDVLIVIGGSTNFRTRLPLLYSCYKDRKDNYRPPNLKEVRELIITLFPYQVSDDCEADDLIGHYQYLGRNDQSYIVVTEDKDAVQTPGFILNPRTEEITDCNGFGELDLITKVSSSGSKSYKLKGRGRKFLYAQLIYGDRVDTYHPFPKTYSDLKTHKLLNDCETDKDCWEVIVKEYKSHYENITEWQAWDDTLHQGTWLDILQVYFDVAFMQRWEGDKPLVKDILKSLDITV